MKITKTHLRKIIKEEVVRVCHKYTLLTEGHGISADRSNTGYVRKEGERDESEGEADKYYFYGDDTKSSIKVFQPEDIKTGGSQAEFDNDPERFAQHVINTKGFKNFSVFDRPKPDVTTWPVAIVIDGYIRVGDEMEAHIERGQRERPMGRDSSY